MNYYDNETNIIESFQNSLEYGDVLCISNNEKELISILESFEPGNWESWTNSSAKNAPPPDFYNDELKIMMEVMRADDHGFISPKGKTVNPTRQRESEIMCELQEKGVLDKFPNAKLFIKSSYEKLLTRVTGFG